MSTLYVCLHDAMDRSTESIQQAMPALAAQRCPGSRGMELCQPAHRTVPQGYGTMSAWWHLPFPLGQSSCPLKETEQSYVPRPLYITCASSLQDNPWSDIQHTRQQPRHYSSASVMLTNELHTRNCSHMLSSDSISPPILALAKRKIAFNISKVLLL